MKTGVLKRGNKYFAIGTRNDGSPIGYLTPNKLDALRVYENQVSMIVAELSPWIDDADFCED